MTREEAIQILSTRDAHGVLCGYTSGVTEALDMAISALSAEPIERISDNTIVVKYADYEDIGRIILTNGDIFCKMFYEDARQNDDSDYDSLVPDEYKTEPSDLISRADAIEAVCRTRCGDKAKGCPAHSCLVIEEFDAIPSANPESDDLIIKGAKGIQDGPYNITDGKLFKYKANGGTVRTYPIVPSADAVHGFRGGKIPPKEMLDGTVLIPQHQWLEMEKELAELKDRFGSADAEQSDECDHCVYKWGMKGGAE